MQFFKIVLVTLVLMVNLVIGQPAWAGKDFTKGADYAEVTQALNQLLTVADELSLLLINQEIHFITRLKAKASIKYLKIFSYDHSINLGLD
ncbi:hypothetical protein [Nostoc sp.]|uniref:hypothetical protein n=1 Tax=Nostoc sp. TaxID=1180 RepID=UPI002FFA2236